MNHPTAAAAFFIALQIVIVATYATSQQQYVLFWYCNHAPALFAVAFWLRNVQAVKGLISFGIIAQIAWTFDFISALLFGIPPLGLTEYVFDAQHTWSDIVSIIAHTASTLVALALTYRYRPHTVALSYAGAYILASYAVILLLHPYDNPNCVLASCLDTTLLDFAAYTPLWPLLAMLGLVVPAHLLQALVARYPEYRNSTSQHMLP